MSRAIHEGSHFDLRARARLEMIRDGFEPDMPSSVADQLDAKRASSTAEGHLRDCTDLRWSSIDNRESRDLDQVEVAGRLANNTIRLR